MTAAGRNMDNRKPSVPWWEQILRGERNDLLAQSIRRFAQLSSWGYAAGVRGRELAYRHGFLSVKRLPKEICTPSKPSLAASVRASGLAPRFRFQSVTPI